MKDKRDKVGVMAFQKARQLNNLIIELQNTTIGDLNSDVANLQKKIDSLSTLFNISYNNDGTINQEEYTTHTHKYKDATINDTEDGSGTENIITKDTDGVNL